MGNGDGCTFWQSSNSLLHLSQMGSRTTSGLAEAMALAEGEVTGLAVVRAARVRMRGVVYLIVGGVGLVWFGV